MTARKKFLFLILGGSLLIIPHIFCRHHYPSLCFTPFMRTHDYEPSDPAPTLTVWIHGTHFVYNTLRLKPFCVDHPLQPYRALTKKSSNLRMVGRALTHFYPDRSSDLIYFYAWSGILKRTEREHAACVLYHELTSFIEKYEKKHGIKPKIRLVTHSHGGNVALNLARINIEKGHSSHPPLIIDELVLLACPVQINTMCYTVHPTFKKIYSFSSSLDFIQIIAPQLCHKKNKYCYLQQEHYHITTNPPFSGRYFAPAPHLFNIKMRMNGRALLHSEFMRYPFLSIIPEIIMCLNSKFSESLNLFSCVTASYNSYNDCITICGLPHY